MLGQTAQGPMLRSGRLQQRCAVRPCRLQQQLLRGRLLCRATEETTSKAEGDKMSKTVSTLDALLGITDDPKDAMSAKPSAASERSEASASTSAPASTPGSAGVPSTKGDAEFEDQFQKIIEKARQLGSAQAGSKDAKPGGGNLESQQAQLRQEFESLLQAMSKDQALLDKDDIKRLKDACFGPMTFWVTEIANVNEPNTGNTGVLVRGNLRDDRTKVFENVCAKVKELFDGKYEVLLIEDADPVDPDAPVSPAQAARGPKVAFQIVPVAQTLPPVNGTAKQLAAAVLFFLFVASCLQLALVANITKLPKETLEFFANPENFNSNSDVLPPGLDTWDPSTYLVTAIPTFIALLGINASHELGHRIAAAVKGVKLAPSFFIPNLQLGAFGAITPFASMLKNRAQMWDVSAAGPLAGFLASGAVLLIGLSQSTPGFLPKELLVPVPSALFQGSLLLGSITKALLGGDALRGSEDVLVSPFVIAGWCGLITNALNMLPVGSLDGGRLVHAAYGKQALSLTSFFTFVGLGLGLLGGSLSLPFGLYVVICQRTAEKYIQDNVTAPSDAQRNATAVAILTAILILVPMAPEFADQLGVGTSNPFL